LTQAAVKLGVSQRALETEYYIVDLPLLLRLKTHEIAENRLITLQIATVSQGADKDVYTEFVARLRGDLITDSNECQTNTDEFDRSAIERLRGRIGRR